VRQCLTMVADLVVVIEPGEPCEVRAEGCKWLILPRTVLGPTTMHFNKVTLNLEIVRLRTRESEAL
jgi:hypothetical protein